jgi:hypothetical protein
MSSGNSLTGQVIGRNEGSSTAPEDQVCHRSRRDRSDSSPECDRTANGLGRPPAQIALRKEDHYSGKHPPDGHPRRRWAPLFFIGWTHVCSSVDLASMVDEQQLG